MIYECDQCTSALPAGVTACPKCGEKFDDAVPADAEIHRKGFTAVSLAVPPVQAQSFSGLPHLTQAASSPIPESSAITPAERRRSQLVNRSPVPLPAPPPSQPIAPQKFALSVFLTVIACAGWFIYKAAQQSEPPANTPTTVSDSVSSSKADTSVPAPASPPSSQTYAHAPAAPAPAIKKGSVPVAASDANGTDSIEYKMVVLERGDYVAPDDPAVAELGRALDKFQTKSDSPRDRLANVAALVHDQMKERGVDESYLSILTHVYDALPDDAHLHGDQISGPFAAYATLRAPSN